METEIGILFYRFVSLATVSESLTQLLFQLFNLFLPQALSKYGFWKIINRKRKKRKWKSVSERLFWLANNNNNCNYQYYNKANSSFKTFQNFYWKCVWIFNNNSSAIEIKFFLNLKKKPFFTQRVYLFDFLYGVSSFFFIYTRTATTAR